MKACPPYPMAEPGKQDDKSILVVSNERMAAYELCADRAAGLQEFIRELWSIYYSGESKAGEPVGESDQ